MIRPAITFITLIDMLEVKVIKVNDRNIVACLNCEA